MFWVIELDHLPSGGFPIKLSRHLDLSFLLWQILGLQSFTSWVGLGHSVVYCYKEDGMIIVQKNSILKHSSMKKTNDYYLADYIFKCIFINENILPAASFGLYLIVSSINIKYLYNSSV